MNDPVNLIDPNGTIPWALLGWGARFVAVAHEAFTGVGGILATACFANPQMCKDFYDPPQPKPSGPWPGGCNPMFQTCSMDPLKPPPSKSPGSCPQ